MHSFKELLLTLEEKNDSKQKIESAIKEIIKIAKRGSSTGKLQKRLEKMSTTDEMNAIDSLLYVVGFMKSIM